MTSLPGQQAHFGIFTLLVSHNLVHPPYNKIFSSTSWEKILIMAPRQMKQHKEYFTDTSYSFFTLPPELRLKVYNYLMNDLELRPRSATPVKTLELHWDNNPCKPLSAQFLRTCKIIYHEGLPALYYGRTAITYDLAAIHQELEYLGPRMMNGIKAIIFESSLLCPYTIPRVRGDHRWLMREDARSRFHLPLPDMPSLKSITIRANRVHHEVFQRRLEARILELMRSPAGGGHFLTQYMRLTTNPQVS